MNARYQQTQQQLTAVTEASSANDQQAALEALTQTLEGETFKARHTPATPEQLPWGSPSSEVREPVDNPQDLQANLGLNPYAQYAQLAQSDTDPDLIARALANAANQQVQAALAQTLDAQLTPEIRALAAELNHQSTEIYAWVHNNIRYIPSHGSIQGAQHTLETKRGNAIDTASLLIALLRASDIPARYAYGSVRLPAEQVMNWVGGVQTPEAALNLLGQGGIPVRGLTQGGRIAFIEIEHVWVEAWVDYIPSRGMKDRGGDSWIPMDASFKQYDFSEGMNLQTQVPFDAEGLVTQIQQSATVNESEGWVQNVPQAAIEQQLNDFQAQLENYITNQNPDATVGEVLGLQEIKILPPRPLAAGLPYQRILTSQTFSEVPNNLRHKFQYTLSTQTQGYEGEQILRIEESTVKLAGKTLALSFKPATEADEAIIAALLPEPDENGEIDPNQLPNTLPGYLIGLTAEFTINNQVIASGPANTLGTELHETLGLWSPKEGWRNSTNFPTAGQYRAIGLDLQGSNQRQAQRLRQQLGAVQAKFESQQSDQILSITRHDLVGSLLQATLQNYFYLNNLHNEMAAPASDIIIYRLPSYGTFSTSLQTQYWFGIPRNVSFTGVNMDMDRIADQAVNKANNTEEAATFQEAIGARMSAMEHQVPEEIFSSASGRAQGVSAVKAISIASAEGQKIWIIDQDNLNLALSSINLGADTERDIRNAVHAGKIVTAHESQINFNGWIGEGYIILEPNTGAGAYLIAGGSNGGQTQVPQGGGVPPVGIVTSIEPAFFLTVASETAAATATFFGAVKCQLSSVAVTIAVVVALAATAFMFSRYIQIASIPAIGMEVGLIIKSAIVSALALAGVANASEAYDRDCRSCQEHYVACLGTSLNDLPGDVHGSGRCNLCRNQCVQRDGVWPDIAITGGKSVRCDYWNF